MSDNLELSRASLKYSTGLITKTTTVVRMARMPMTIRSSNRVNPFLDFVFKIIINIKFLPILSYALIEPITAITTKNKMLITKVANEIK